MMRKTRGHATMRCLRHREPTSPLLITYFSSFLLIGYDTFSVAVFFMICSISPVAQEVVLSSATIFLRFASFHHCCIAGCRCRHQPPPLCCSRFFARSLSVGVASRFDGGRRRRFFAGRFCHACSPTDILCRCRFVFPLPISPTSFHIICMIDSQFATVLLALFWRVSICLQCFSCTVLTQGILSSTPDVPLASSPLMCACRHTHTVPAAACWCAAAAHFFHFFTLFFHCGAAHAFFPFRHHTAEGSTSFPVEAACRATSRFCQFPRFRCFVIGSSPFHAVSNNTTSSSTAISFLPKIPVSASPLPRCFAEADFSVAQYQSQFHHCSSAGACFCPFTSFTLFQSPSFHFSVSPLTVSGKRQFFSPTPHLFSFFRCFKTCSTISFLTEGSGVCSSAVSVNLFCFAQRQHLIISFHHVHTRRPYSFTADRLDAVAFILPPVTSTFADFPL